MAGPWTSCGGNAGHYGVRQAGEPQCHICPNCYKFTGVWVNLCFFIEAQKELHLKEVFLPQDLCSLLIILWVLQKWSSHVKCSILMVSNIKVLLYDLKNGTEQALQSPFTMGNSFFRCPQIYNHEIKTYWDNLFTDTLYKKWIKGVSFIRNYTAGQWGSITRLFSFINCVDNVNWPLYLLYHVI